MNRGIISMNTMESTFWVTAKITAPIIRGATSMM